MRIVENSIDEKKVCYHCGTTGNQFLSFDEKCFCCNGCKTVYEILATNSLCTYYNINASPGLKIEQQIATDKYDYLNDPQFAERFIQYKQGNKTHIQFSLPSMHCSSCLWLLKRLNLLVQGVEAAQVNFENKTIIVIYDVEKTKLSTIAHTLASIGYEPELAYVENETLKQQKRTTLIKIGIAGFCFANIMMLSFPEYLNGGNSVGGKLAMVFNWVSFLLSLPVLFYAASDFFKVAWSGLRKGVLNIELPVTIALVVTFLRSIYEQFVLYSNGYYDSLSGIVFFMLVGRWVQYNTARHINFNRDFKSFFPIAVQVLNGDKVVFKKLNTISQHDIIKIRQYEIVPVDSILIADRACFDYSFITGESLPININKGDRIFAGAKLVSMGVTVSATKTVDQSYLTNLWSRQIDANKSDEDAKVNGVGLYFTYVVLSLAIAASIFWMVNGKSNLALNAFTTVLIVACPCALLLSEHFVNGNLMGIFGHNGFYVSHKKVFNNMLSVDTIVFDKTGTLTTANKAVVTYTGEVLDENHFSNVKALLAQSNHPLSNAVLWHYGATQLPEIESIKVMEGKGIEGWVADIYYKLGSSSFVQLENHIAKGAEIHITIDGVYFGYFGITQQYKKGITQLISVLNKKYNTYLLSGDNSSEANLLKEVFGTKNQLYFNMTPTDKLMFIESLQEEQKSVMFIGDGLNDAVALRKAEVGIAVANNSSLFTPNCDVIIEHKQLIRINDFIALTQKARKIIWVTFMISAVYNLVGLMFALQGILNPFIAAILMPLSSLTIIGTAYFTMIYYAKKYKLKTN